MATCIKCGKKGLFLKLNKDKLCEECEKIQNRSKKVHIANSENKKDISNMDYKNTSIVNNSEIKNTKLRFLLHEDLSELIWTDGNDPSVISASLPIDLKADESSVEPLPYYPNYREISPQQRGVYIKFLSNPYQKIEIGYVFLLYYGLERHLVQGNYEKAFHVIIKLRDVHSNKSFQNYSSSALVYTAIKRKRKDLLIDFINSIDKQYEEQIPFNILMTACKLFNLEITASCLMRYASQFAFTNNRYIKGNHELFEKVLKAVLYETYNVQGLPVDTIELDKLPSCGQTIYANVYLNKNAMDFPDITQAYTFIGAGNRALTEAHERVKKELKNSTKTQLIE